MQLNRAAFGKTHGCEQGSKNRGENDRENCSFRGLLEGYSAGILYSPITAADEKIALSIGQVNIKPQHLVFSL
jgi:hypothetical protein